MIPGVSSAMALQYLLLLLVRRLLLFDWLLSVLDASFESRSCSKAVTTSSIVGLSFGSTDKQ